MVLHTFKINDQERNKNWLQISAIIIATLSSFSTGIFLAWPSAFVTKISEDKVNYDITEEESSYFAVIPHVVTLACCPLFSKSCDIIGRRNTLLLAIIPQLLSFILKAIAKSVYTFYAARCLSGISDGVVYSVLPIYIGEISTPEIRGTWGNAFTVTLTSGVFFINLVGIYFSVQQTSYICLLVPLTFAILFPLMPESPYFYLMKGKDEAAQDTLRKLRRKKNVQLEFTSLKKDVDRQMSESGTWSDLFKIKSNRRALIVAIFVRISQQLSGMIVFAIYTKFIFEKSGSNIDPNLSTIICTGLTTILLFPATFTVDKLGRRKSYVLSLSFSIISLVVLSFYFYTKEYLTNINLQSWQWVPFASLVWFLIFASLGLGPVPILMLGEIFSSSIKTKGITIVILVQGISNSFVTYLFYFLSVSCGFYSPFLFFTICSLVCLLLTLYILPETSGKTLEEIQQVLKGNLK